MCGQMDQDTRLSEKRLRRNVLQAELSEEELWECDEFQQLEQEIQSLEAEQSD